ncbi:hypothetical protein CDV50_11955 [Haematobacter massiliensis]|uniref:Uncharacterized protein n=1 Tax=Haematobacter massiliensis TaxID=195105 RepID=A0A086XZ93_9RHOB|nr:hypothetical protein [Haematobacter massiliensis]KFI27343.1 hypothetical protein CN97_01135 [Haematobacter massiliensis]OWJ70760.1 hypothetical protein CDV50_11955 [Haematobacter massiliensis]OWJ84822.1 hypothetical protein CDV51_13040 [Haematobacter massiliensis]QBJ23788.1 hypothetical protein HmaOT1_05695 [Haematobacter massiliensis]
MSLTPERLEAMIVAHRKVLRDLMVSLPRDRLDDLRQRLTRGETVQDGAEDPGVLPQEAFSFEAAVAEETRLLLRMVGDIVDQPARRRTGDR